MGKYLIIMLSVVFLVGGCASMQELTDEVIKARNSGKAGVAKVYPVGEEQAWDITRAVFRWEKTDAIQEHHDGNYVIAGTGMQMVAFGSVMGVWIEPVDPEHTRLTVITMRRTASDSFTRLTISRFFERFDQGLKIVKSGKELPVIAPQEK